MFHEVPAPGFKLVPGDRAPRDKTREYQIQLRSGWVCELQRYTAKQLVWIHTDHPFDVVAVR